MTVGSIFSGLGGSDLAATWAGWETLFHCEINPFCRTILKYYWPHAKTYSDIKQTDFTIYRGKLDVLCGGFPCFKKGTKVLTEDGYRNIEELKINDFVLTKQGNWKPVNAVMVKENAPTIDIKFHGDYEPITTTHEHPFWVRKRNKPHARIYKNKFDSEKWINAGDIKKGDLVGVRCVEGTTVFKDENFWYMVGRYLGDGWISDYKRRPDKNKGMRSRDNSFVTNVIICCAKDEKEELAEIIKKAGYRYCVSEERTAYRFIITNQRLQKFLKGFGRYAHGKRLPGICHELKTPLKKALFDGWISADGHINGNNIQATTISPDLARGMAAIARDSYKVAVSVSKIKVKEKTIIEERIVNQKTQYHLSLSLNSNMGFYEDGFVWSLVKNVSKGIFQTVYNIGVYEDESYTAAGIAVHNCQPNSVAGQRKGTDDDRYLWPQMRRAYQESQPRIIVAENVTGILSVEDKTGVWKEVFPKVESRKITRYNNIDYYEAIYSRQSKMLINTICENLEEDGYEAIPIVIPAAAVGAPHRRDRVWIIGYPKHYGSHGAQSGRNDPQSPLTSGQNEIRKSQGAIGIRSGSPADTNSDDAGGYRHGQTGRAQGEAESEGSQWEWFRAFTERTGEEGDVTDAISPELERSKNEGISGKGRKEYNQQPTRFLRPNWDNFPTQSPVCGGDDGIPSRLDGITVSKLRTESIKGLGNAWVPQIAYEIFKMINRIEDEKLYRP